MWRFFLYFYFMNYNSSQKKTLVLGASLKTERYSNRAILSLSKYNIPTWAIGLKEGRIGEVTIEKGKPTYTNIHTITLYLNPNNQKEYYEYILLLKPQRVIFNPGTENPDFMSLLDDNNIDYEVACTLTLLAIGQY